MNEELVSINNIENTKLMENISSLRQKQNFRKYSEAYRIVKCKIASTANNFIACQNCTLFTESTSVINRLSWDSLLFFIRIIFRKCWQLEVKILWNYFWDESTVNLNNSKQSWKSLEDNGKKFKSYFFKYLANILRRLEISLITSDIELNLDLSKTCIFPFSTGENLNIRNTNTLCISSNCGIWGEI